MGEWGRRVWLPRKDSLCVLQVVRAPTVGFSIKLESRRISQRTVEDSRCDLM